VVRAWWDAQDPKPTTKFVALVQVVERLLRVGWTEPELVTAVAQCPTLSAGWLEPKLRALRNPPTNGYRPSYADQAQDRIADEDEMLREQLRQGAEWQARVMGNGA